MMMCGILRVRKAAAVIWVMGAALISFASSVAFAAGTAHKLVGTWRLVHFVDTDPSGKVTYPFGEKPIGYFMYDATGHLSVQIMRTPARPAFASGDDQKGTDKEVRAAYYGYFAYFGTYRLDEAKSVVTHVVEGSLYPSYTGTERPRPFKLEGDTLIIQIHDKDGSSYFRELHRVK
jgi:Lipocalin-like domain